ncbi:MAG TPA: tRNA 2-thiouridine(34) synthase MnmA [Oscillospiraceae bacterium]|nr:tRNA 2-thiouridine(34) synthase MnmA [Oscillospiraceae bacterium]
MREKVVLGLSGGVDSAVSASLLSETYDVSCLYLDVGFGGGEDARRVAEFLSLPFAVLDVREALEEHVCGPFARDYLAGRTPLPCARCNPLVKFPALLRHADETGARLVATGHYARRAAAENGRALLLRGRPGNDQSYMLARLPQEILARTIFPLGERNKAEVRALAASRGIPVASKPDSMEICFIPSGDYGAWLEARGETPPPGDFVDERGNVLGRHRGIHRYTLGQRRGLGVALGARRFVSRIDPAANRVVLSGGEELLVTEALCESPNWIAVAAPEGPMEVTARFRHSRTETPAVIAPEGDLVRVTMQVPARAPTPGQLAVFYRDEIVIGSAWLRERRDP